jgi:hypothetical protein
MRFSKFMASVGVATVLAGAALVSFVPAANASTVVYNFDGSSVTPAFTATVSLDVTGGQASSGTGNIDFSGNIFDLTLITLATPGGNYGGATGFRDNHGTDIFGGDTVIPIDTNGLIFAITNNPVWGANALFAVWSTGGDNYQFLLSGTLPDVFNVYYVIGDVTGSAEVSATPLPAAFPLFVSGLGALGLLGWRRKRKAAAIAA